MKRFFKVFLLMLLVAAFTTFAVSCGKTDDTTPGQTTTPDNPSPNTPTDPDAPTEPTDPTPNNPSTPENPTPNNPSTPENPTPNNPSTPENPTPNNPSTPENPTPDVQETEEEYKQKFLSELPQMIEESFNSKVENTKMYLHDVEVLDINGENGDIYVNCTRNNHNMFYVYNKQQLTNFSSYEDLYNNFDRDFGIPNTLKSALETTLANEIATFALEQDTVKEYIAANVGDYSEYTVLNATKFNSINGYRTTSLKLKFENKILNINLGGRTGYLKTQEEYFEGIKDDLKITFGETENYSEFKATETPSNSYYDSYIDEIE